MFFANFDLQRSIIIYNVFGHLATKEAPRRRQKGARIAYHGLFGALDEHLAVVIRRALP